MREERSESWLALSILQFRKSSGIESLSVHKTLGICYVASYHITVYLNLTYKQFREKILA